MFRRRTVTTVLAGLATFGYFLCRSSVFVGPSACRGSGTKITRANHPSQIFPPGLAGGAPAATPAMNGNPASSVVPPPGASVPGQGAPRLPSVPMPYGDVAVDLVMMRFSHFVPRLYNFCRGLGMTKGRIMPSIGFCADENQGFPAMIITKHFGAYPFTHGYLGGIMALDRHGPHSHHGEDMVIIHAPHVGYDPDAGKYGVYRRRQIGDLHHSMSTCCGKVAGVLAPYVESYEKALGRISVREAKDGVVLLNIGNSLLNPEEDDLGIALNFDRMVEPGGMDNPLLLQSTSVVYIASQEFADLYKKVAPPSGQSPAASQSEVLKDMDAHGIAWKSLKSPELSSLLTQDFFSFRKTDADLPGEANRLERVLVPHLPFILTAPHDPEFTAALIVMQSEFDRGVHSIVTSDAYEGRNLVLISGLNVDIAPPADDMEAFPQTMFLPWAAYVQLADGSQRVIEQDALVTLLHKQSTDNQDAMNLERGFEALFGQFEKKILFHNTRDNKIDEVRTV
mmetsp:Transcript_53843/g.125561  ORF Transcript_53843/g.125561 Transcript_53843/m.125561 type:complete len:509 (+) Transcript_53843:55-1581(+)